MGVFNRTLGWEELHQREKKNPLGWRVVTGGKRIVWVCSMRGEMGNPGCSYSRGGGRDGDFGCPWSSAPLRHPGFHLPAGGAGCGSGGRWMWPGCRFAERSLTPRVSRPCAAGFPPCGMCRSRAEDVPGMAISASAAPRCSGSLRWPTASIATQRSAKTQPLREIFTEK